MFWSFGRHGFVSGAWRKIITTNFQEFERFEKNRNNLLWHLFSEKWYYKMLFRIKFWTTFYYFVFFAVIQRVIITHISWSNCRFISNVSKLIFFNRLRHFGEPPIVFQFFFQPQRYCKMKNRKILGNSLHILLKGSKLDSEEMFAYSALINKVSPWNGTSIFIHVFSGKVLLTINKV